MSSIDKRRRERIKRKRAEREAHVTPMPGRQARQTRRQTGAESRFGGFSLPTRRAPGDAEPVIPMTPRPNSLAARRAERRREKEFEANRPTERVRPRGLIWLNWRWFSGFLSILLVILLYGLLVSEAFYVTSISVGGVNHLTREEVFRFSGISQMHLFWIDPEAVENRLQDNSNIASAEVRVGWPPNMVQILVREREPVITWEQANDRVWVDINGYVMFQRQDRPDLLRIIYDPSLPDQEALGPNNRIDPRIIEGALILKRELPNIDVMLYHPLKGLGWRDPGGWMAWFGVGDNMAMKAVVYEALVAANEPLFQFGEINVSDPDNPVFTYLWRK